LVPTLAKYTLAKPGTWTHELAIFALDDKDVPVNSIVVVARPALDLEGGHETEVWADPVDSAIDSPRFHRQAPARVIVWARFESPGTYATSIYVSAGGAPAIAELSIEVKPAASPAALPVTQVGSAQAVAEVEVGESPTVGIWLASTSDTAQTIAGVKGRFGRKVGGHTVAAGATATLHEPSAAARVAPHTSTRVDVDVASLDEPGEYTGDLEFDPGGDRPPIAATMTVYARYGALRAGMWIALGVVVTLLIALVRDWLQPRSELRIAIQRLQVEIDAARPASETIAAAWRQLSAEAAKLASKVSEGVDTQLRSDVESLGKRVALVHAATASAAAISELTSVATQRAKRKIIDDVLAIAVDSTGKADDGFAKLRELGIDDARRTELGQALDALSQSVEEHRASLDPALVAAIETTVDPAIEAAQDARASDDLVSLYHELGRARTALATAGLHSMIMALQHRPTWAGADDWQKLVDGVTKEIPPEPSKLADKYESIRDAYVVEVEKLLRHLAGEWQSAHPLGNVDVTAALKAVDEAQTRRDRVAALRVLQDLLFPPEPGTAISDRVLLSTASAAPDAPPGYAIGVRLVPGLPDVTRARLGAFVSSVDSVPWSAIQHRLLLSRVSVSFVVFVLALLGGLKLLWIDSVTWGTPGDQLTAFLWGTGAKLTADAFGGIAWLRNALGKAA
jgi:hypothetical protein